MSLVIALVLLAANGFFVAAEFALVAARRGRIEQLAEEGAPGARHALAGIRELSLMLAAAQLGITMASLGLGAVAEPAVAHWLEGVIGTALPPQWSHAVALAVALSVVIFFHMVVGEMAPKSWAIAHPERSALQLARPFRLFALLVRPGIWGLNRLANLVVRLVGVEPQDELALVHSPADLVLLLRESTREGTVTAEQSELLSRSIRLAGLDAQAMMVPRSEIVAVPGIASIDELESVASRTGRSRIPVYEGELDHIRGIVHVKDLLDVDPALRHERTASHLARPVLITPESRPLEDLMLDMRQQRQHMAIVVDEYGAVSGLVALEDVIEEIIGEFEDESDLRRHAVRRRADGAWVVPGALRPDELATRTGITLPEGDYETVAGFVLAALGRIPDPGDLVETQDLRIEVMHVLDNRIVELAITD